MKTIAFYNEKGGVGKSSFTIMYASWLRYKHGLRVAVVDFNGRQEMYRTDELNKRKKTERLLLARKQKALEEGRPFNEPTDVYSSIKAEDLWPIVTVERKDTYMLKKSGVKCPAINIFQNIMRKMADYDVLLLDFPGATQGEEFIQLLSFGAIGLCCIITDRDMQTIRATLAVKKAVQSCPGVRMVAFMNQVQSFVNIREYEELVDALASSGLDMLPDMVSYSERMKKISEPDIMRSTVDYPDWNSKTFEGSRDLGLENLFTDISHELRKTEDMPHTGKADMSFVDALEKTLEGQQRRQTICGCFPEYEFPLESFPKDRQAWLRGKIEERQKSRP